MVHVRSDLLVAAPAVLGRLRDQGTEVVVWTVDDPAEAARCLAMGVGRITTNQVGTLLDWKRSLPGA